MKQYIKDGQIYDLPIIIQENDGSLTYTNDENLIFAAGYKEYIYSPPKKTLEELINESNENINKQTDEKILNNFVWNENAFYLTSENQMNFSNLFIAKDYLTYPQFVKTKTGFIELQSIEEVTSFYLAGINFIKLCLEEGWLLKAAAEVKIRNNYNSENNNETENNSEKP